MKCILLVRVSTESQSYDEQQKELYELADRYGYKESHIVSVAERESGIKLDEEERAGLNKMKELISDDKRTVVIVSHNSKTIIELCDKVIWLHEGLIKDEGDPETIMNEYEQFMRNEG